MLKQLKWPRIWFNGGRKQTFWFNNTQGTYTSGRSISGIRNGQTYGPNNLDR